MGLLKDIGRGPVGLDTSVFIFYVEEDPAFLQIVSPLIEAIGRAEPPASASGLALMEVLVAPYRRGNLAVADRYEALLTRSRGLRLVEVSAPVLKLAAHLRATTRVKTPDAIHLASALASGCSSFLTYDRRLPQLPGLRILHLSDYLPPPTALRESRPGRPTTSSPGRRRRRSRPR